MLQEQRQLTNTANSYTQVLVNDWFAPSQDTKKCIRMVIQTGLVCFLKSSGIISLKLTFLPIL